MHEVSIAEDILDLLEAEMGVPGPLSEVELEIGPLSGVHPESLDFCFPVVARQRGFGSPVLRIRRIPVLLLCEACSERWSSEDIVASCPRCGAHRRTVLAGDELRLVGALLEEPVHV